MKVTKLAGGMATAVAVAALAVAPTAATAKSKSKSCSSGYTTGTIDGATKCLKVGELCSHSYASQYTKYGFSCTSDKGKYYLKKG